MGCIDGDQTTGTLDVNSCSDCDEELSALIDLCELESGPDACDEKSAPVICFNLTQTKIDVARERHDCWPRLTAAAAKVPFLRIYEACRGAAAYNLLGPRKPIKTCNNVRAWEDYSTGHSDDKWLIECITYGFPLQYRGPPIHNKFVDNHPSAKNFPTDVGNYITKEMALGAIIGPFSEPPFVP